MAKASSRSLRITVVNTDILDYLGFAHCKKTLGKCFEDRVMLFGRNRVHIKAVCRRAEPRLDKQVRPRTEVPDTRCCGDKPANAASCLGEEKADQCGSSVSRQAAINSPMPGMEVSRLGC